MTPLVTVRHARGSYPVWFGRGLLERTGELVSVPGQVFVVAGEPLRTSFGERVARSFVPAGELLVIPDGEGAKTLATVDGLLTQLLERRARRSATVVATGGGVAGDTAGFAAAIFMRGVALVQVPTTLLAQVDSAIGGKVGVNHPLGKNMIGAFHPPRAVVVDPDALTTLPPREWTSGLFEALKGGVIADPALFELFEAHWPAIEARHTGVIDEVLSRKIRVKAEIVSADERESNLRRVLNYGHTIGHGLEAALHYEGLTHGEAVGWGMLAANAVAVRRGILPAASAARIDGVIRTCALPPIPPVDRGAVLAAAGLDKKNTSASRVMALPRRVGECVIVEDVAADEVAYGIDAILT